MTTSQTDLLGFRLVKNPRSDQWGVPVSNPDLGVILIDWMVSAPPIDAGVPFQAADLLAKLFTKLAWVSFLGAPSENAHGAVNNWHKSPEGWTSRWRSTSFLNWLRQPLPATATRNSDIARALFLSEDFDWNQQDQIGVLTDPSSDEGIPDQPPPLNGSDLFQVIKRNELASLLRSKPWLGLVLPGVDGDFAAVVSTRSSFLATFGDELARSCAQARLNVEWGNEAAIAFVARR